MADADRAIAVRDNPQTRRETSDADVRAIGWIALGLAVFVILSIAILGAVFSEAMHPRDKALASLPPEPRLQTDPAADLQRFNAGMAQRLGSYGQVADAPGIVHIPIDEAMKQVVERGIPDWPGSAR